MATAHSSISLRLSAAWRALEPLTASSQNCMCFSSQSSIRPRISGGASGPGDFGNKMEKTGEIFIDTANSGEGRGGEKPTEKISSAGVNGGGSILEIDEVGNPLEKERGIGDCVGDTDLGGKGGDGK